MAIKDQTRQKFHGASKRDRRAEIFLGNKSQRLRTVEYSFALHQHPFVTELMRSLIRRSVAGLQEADTQAIGYDRDFFRGYHPAKARFELPATPKNRAYVARNGALRYKLDFDTRGAYAQYNFELFFFVPFAIGVHLSRNQRFAEAREWIAYLFDPRDNTNEDPPQRYWKYAPFKSTDVEDLVAMLRNLSDPTDEDLLVSTLEGLAAWRERPFSPHVVARYWPSVYKQRIVMAYLDNLIAWGDHLFLQDTAESLDEARIHYGEAWTLLGDQPQRIPRAGTLRPETYESIRKDLDEFSNVLRDLQTDLPFDTLPLPPEGVEDAPSNGATDSLGRSLYFCVPPNDRFKQYYDTVKDRLFKIHNSLNFRGIFRQLPLFDPPIDPGKLAAAAAAGVDVAAIVAGANTPLPSVRFAFLLQRAISACQEAKSLAGLMLSSTEKDDAEALSLMRMRHEREILSLSEAVKYGQFQEATKSLESTVASLENAFQRYEYFEQLLGRKPDELALPEYTALDKDALAMLKLKATEPSLDARAIEIDIAQDVGDVAAGRLISSYEAQELQLGAEARGLQTAAAVVDLIAGILGLIPQFDIHGTPFGVGAAVDFGGTQLSKMTSAISSGMRIGADILMNNANLAGRVGGFARREQEWALQSNNVQGEITQIYKQYRAAEIRAAVAEMEWQNHKRQIEQAKEIDRFYTDARSGKQAGKAVYAWMKRETAGLSGRSFDYALEIARKAERALQHELGNREARFLTGDYSTGMFGLLAGERLLADLYRMELEYQERQPPVMRPVVHVPLSQIDPLALIQLRTTGRCRLAIPEPYLDLQGPGEYFRRIQSVTVSIPSVVGPYASVHCKLTLTNSTVRTSPFADTDGYTREGQDDLRFEDYRGLVHSIVVSGTGGDSGGAESTDASRYLPFENHGVVSEWELQLPADPSKGEPTTFDYETIADVVLSIRYSARDGGERLKAEAKKALMAMLDEANAGGTARVFSLRQEFPDAWAQFKRHAVTAASPAPLTIELRAEHYPFWAKGRIGNLTQAVLLARRAPAAPAPAVAGDATGGGVADTALPNPGQVDSITLTNNRPASTVGAHTFYLTSNAMADVWLFVAWKR